MTIFISNSEAQQPAFLYASYPIGTTVSASPLSPGQTPGAILLADESDGYSFTDVSGSPCLVIDYPAAVQCDCFALCGSGLSGVSVQVVGSNDNFAAENVVLLESAVCASDGTFWSQHDSGTFASFKYVFSGLTTKTKIRHLAAAVFAFFPCFADGACFHPLQAEGDHLISHAGYFLGSTTHRVMRPFNLSFGQVTPVEEVLFSSLVAACVQKAQGLFFIPDSGKADVHFGWIDKKYKYEPKMKNGQYTIPPIPFTSRAV